MLEHDINEPNASYTEISVCDGWPGCLEYCRLEQLPNEEPFYRLIAAMTEQIDLLEAEVVRTRQALIKHLSPRWAEGLYDDIFSNLSMRFAGDYEAYDNFIRDCCDGTDPLESDEHVARMLRLRDGTDETTYRHLW